MEYYFWLLERDSFHKNPEIIFGELQNFEHKSNHWKPVIEFLKLYVPVVDEEDTIITHIEAEKNLQRCGISRTKLAQKTFSLLKERDSFYPKMGKLIAKTKESLLKKSMVPQSGNQNLMELKALEQEMGCRINSVVLKPHQKFLKMFMKGSKFYSGFEKDIGKNNFFSFLEVLELEFLQNLNLLDKIDKLPKFTLSMDLEEYHTLVKGIIQEYKFVSKNIF